MTSTLDPGTLQGLREWQGREETQVDLIAAAPACALAATLDSGARDVAPGAPLPPLWHWLYFLPQAPAHAIGPDGHPARGGFLPPVPLPRRMWAGGRLHWHAPLRIGDTARRVSRIESVTHKQGKSGDLVFVGVRHELHGPQGLALTEEHDIVYRPMPRPSDAPPAPAAAPTAAPADAAWSRELRPDPVLLFRYSALTFNGHRIHYDRDYAREVEGYPGLVVHGPLIATLLMDLLERNMPQAAVRRFSFRAVRPSFDGRPLRVSGRADAGGADRRVRLWAQDGDGWLTLEADAELA